MANKDGSGRDHFTEKKLGAALASKIGGDNVFAFCYDFRDSAMDIADQLNDFVDAVLKYKNAEQADLFGLSFGGLICGVYLSKYGSQGKIRNAVLDVPALQGSSAVGTYLRGNCEINFGLLVNFVLSFLGVNKTLPNATLGWFGKLFSEVFDGFAEYTSDIILSWESFTDLLTPEDYNALKGKLFDAEKDSEFLTKEDELHNSIMPNYAENFKKCEEAGTRISIICCYFDSGTFLGGNDRSDLLIDTRYSSGATLAKVNETFSDDYRQASTSCGDHSHISTDKVIDASTSYLPDNTWFFKNQYHGLYAENENVLSLVVCLLTADEEISVFSTAEYPQFN